MMAAQSIWSSREWYIFPILLRTERFIISRNNFLIDREGTIVAKDIYGKSLERKLDELTK